MTSWTTIAAGLVMLLAIGSTAHAWQVPESARLYTPTQAERATIEEKIAELGRALDVARARREAAGFDGADAVADAEIAHKVAVWALKFQEFFDARDVGRTLRVLDKGLDRARALAEGRRPWAWAEGGTVRGYRSRIDGSVQPYAVVLPKVQEPDGGPSRLDVVLHGRDARLSEVRFFDAHDGEPAADGQTSMVLHVYGRGNNAFRWAGETDVLEAIRAVRIIYRVDSRRIVLRGFSMGGAGAWHLGLHHPSRWSSVEAGAGFTETIRYAKLVDPSETTRKLLRIYDAVDYARNAYNVPVAGYGGEVDPQAQASLNILEALQAQGVAMETKGLVTTAVGPDFRRIVGKGMGHAVDKDSAAQLKAFHDERAARGSDRLPRRIRFVTYTLKYPEVGWLKILRLGQHYVPATLDADLQGDVADVKTKNVAVLSVVRRPAETVRLDGREFPLPGEAGESAEAVFRRGRDGWRPLDAEQVRGVKTNIARVKHPGVQGPIDDAFTDAFLCIRGTGRPANPRVCEWAEARLVRFAAEWERWMRGTLTIKNDVDVTAQDVANHNLILFGDTGANSWIRDLAPEIGLTWNADECQLRGGVYPAQDHAPVLIQANPRNPLRYVVINTGPTFGAREFQGTNALLYPHLPDFAVFRIGPSEQVVAEGFFDEQWK
ncbi:hypothetical protein [Paludisphaera mucosa]|uniref:Peptidase S9 prolyl oligopeptidase catalytic domain-containing protein n=1 Tax=Paludisphaera mucosa TaxID=3030827 RepID=A0ABT6FFI3_9BACT|nr:hypothetical protein [Paludisphaera mucosa]MDG3006336.1 hypothetical protein [Paludisphaera mucosa]